MGHAHLQPPMVHLVETESSQVLTVYLRILRLEDCLKFMLNVLLKAKRKQYYFDFAVFVGKSNGLV